jgi:hypothetical protein
MTLQQKRADSDDHPKAAYSVQDFAKTHSISRAQAWLLIQRGDIHTVRMGRRRLIPAAAAASWLDSLESVPAKGAAT